MLLLFAMVTHAAEHHWGQGFYLGDLHAHTGYSLDGGSSDLDNCPFEVCAEALDVGGEAQRAAKRHFSDGCAAASGRASMLGPLLAAFGAVEAQGRGSLHPHILVWLILLSLQELLDLLLRDRARFRERVRRWHSFP